LQSINDQLSSDLEAIHGFADAALQNRRHLKEPSDFTYVRIPAFERECGRTRNHFQTSDLGER
jgi:hypothetical protein